MKTFLRTVLLLLLSTPAFAQTAILETNDGTTGTTVNETAIVTSSLTAIAAGTSNSSVPTYIVVGGAGTTGQAQLATSGPASCIMDSTIASAAGWYFVINSTTAAKECHAQSSAPSAGTWVIGYLSSTSTTSGTAAQVVVSSYVYGGSSSGSMTGSQIATALQSLTGCNTATNVLRPQSSDCGANGSGLGTQANNTFFGNVSGSTAVPGSMTVSQAQGLLFPSPGAIGGTTPAAGTFTALNASSVGATTPGTGAFTALTATSLGVGATPPSCGSATGILCLAEASAAGTPAAGKSYIRADSTTHSLIYSINNSAEASLPTSGGSPTFPVNSQLATYQVLAADFSACKTIKVPSGTFTITLVASTSQPTTGQCVDVINYGTGAVTIARSGQNINGGTSSLTVPAGSATAPTGAHIVSDGTDYVAALWGASSGGSFPSNNAGQMIVGAGGTSGNATNAVNAGATSATPVGFGGVEITSPMYEDAYQAAGTVPALGATCASSGAVTCTITNGGSLDPNGGVVWGGVGDGQNDQEWIRYTSATSTTITIPASLGHGYWGSTAASHSSGYSLYPIVKAWTTSATTAPYLIELAAGTIYIGNIQPSSGHANDPNGQGVIIDDILNLSSGTINFGTRGNTNNSLIYTGARAYLTNDNNNATWVSASNAADYNLADQAVTSTSLVALTNVQTPVMPNNGTTVSGSVGGVLSAHCHINWSQATSGTVQFGIAASATPSAVIVSEQDSPGAYLTPTYTNVTTTTTTATSPTITPSAFGTIYASDLTITMVPGNSNSVSVQVYGKVSANTMTVKAGSGCTGWS